MGPKTGPSQLGKISTFAAGFFGNNKALGKFGTYWIELKEMNPAEVRTYEYLLDDKFFTDIDGTEVRQGHVNVQLTVEHKASVYEMTFHLHGTVTLPCDRCLDPMEWPIETDNRLVVKMGKAYTEESDEVLVIAEDEGRVNLAWFLYEFVALAVPMKHVHEPGGCNRTMAAKLRKHVAYDADDAEEDTDEANTDEDESTTDPRWDALKRLKDEEE